jgi:hypothetical protein
MPANKYPRAADPKQGTCFQDTRLTAFRRYFFAFGKVAPPSLPALHEHSVWPPIETSCLKGSWTGPLLRTGSSKLRLKVLIIQKGGRAFFRTTACAGGVGCLPAGP